MIIGNGLIANILSNSSLGSLENIYVYAKGVSNSKCEDDDEFYKDHQAVMQFLSGISHDRKVYYISTCSANTNNANSKYIINKLKCERLVLSRENSYVIRLPQVAGPIVNMNNLCGFLHYAIINNQNINVFKEAKRNIIDIMHIKEILDYIIKESVVIPRIVNIASPINFSMVNFIESIEIRLGKNLKKKYIDGGDSVEIDISYIEKVISDLNLKFNLEYPIDTFFKYYLK